MSSSPPAPWPNAAPPLSVTLHPGLAPGTTLPVQVDREGDRLRLRLGSPSGALVRLAWAFVREGRRLVFVQAPESGAPLVAAEVRGAGALTVLADADLEALRSAPGAEALRVLLMNERAVRAELEAWVAALFRDDPARGTTAETWHGRLTATLAVDGVPVKPHDAAGIDEVEKRADQVPNLRLGYQGHAAWFRVLRAVADASGAYLVLGPADGSLAEAHPVVALAKSWSVEALPEERLAQVEGDVLRALLEDRPATMADLDDLRGLVNLGGPRVPGSFAITDRGEAGGEIVLRGRQQFGASQRRHEAEYLVRTLFEHGGRGYAVLHLPKTLAEKDEVPPRILARVDGRSLLVFPDDAAWHEVAPVARQAMASCRPLDRDLAARIFGSALVSTASLPGMPVVKREAASLAPTPRSTSIEVSHRLGVPVLLEGPSLGRTIVWRGIPLAAPPRLETIESGATVPILRRFVHKDVPYLRIQHPGQGIHCDYALRWISGDLVLLQIAHGWPGPEARRLVVAKRLDQDNLQTLHMRESLRALGQIYPEMERGGRLSADAAAEVFGPMGDSSMRLAPPLPNAVTQALPVLVPQPEVGAAEPTLVGAVPSAPASAPTSETLPPTLPPPELAELLSPEPPPPAIPEPVAPPPAAPVPAAPAAVAPSAPVPAAAAEEAGPRITCLRCEKPVGESDASCPHCGVSRLAPPCPHCGKPVSRALEMRGWFKDESGHYPWHARWDRRCVHCGFEFARRIKLPSGHAHFGSTGEALLSVEAGESAYTVFDFWDHLPTVTVAVRRASPRSDGKPLGDLPGEQQITLTPEEWRAVIDQLEGPLKPLLERRRWTRDTT